MNRLGWRWIFVALGLSLAVQGCTRVGQVTEAVVHKAGKINVWEYAV